MANQLAFALITPHTLHKSRTGGVIARLISRTGLDLAGARMIGPSAKLAEAYAELVSRPGFYPAAIRGRMADYIRTELGPEPGSGRCRRAMLLLFEGPQAVKRLQNVIGDPVTAWDGGDTVRGTYGERITDEDGNITYFEPAVLDAPTPKWTAEVLKLLVKHGRNDAAVLEHAADVPEGKDVESTLVMLKPDNFRFPSLRAGHIVDVLSRSGLRIIAMKKFSMTVAQAEAFYGPVQAVLREKFSERVDEKIAEVLRDAFEIELTPETQRQVTALVGPLAGDAQFEKIVQFMTGHRPSDCPPAQKKTTGSESCIALIYRGRQAVGAIRDILGPTDPSKAGPGSVRKEFGSNIMVNAAHASDSPANAQREMGILRIGEDNVKALVRAHYA